MPKYTKLSAFEYYGTRQTNERWSWSAIADDKSVVAVNIWKDSIKYNDRKEPFYDGFDEQHENTLHLWINEKGNNDRKKHLKHAREKLDGLVRVIIAVAVDPMVYPRGILDVYPLNDLWFKITKFNETTGQFKLEYSHKEKP